IQHGFVARERQTVDLLAEAGAIGDDVIKLAVIGIHVHIDLWVLDVSGQVALDDAAGLVERQAGRLDRAVHAEADGAGRTNLMFGTTRANRWSLFLFSQEGFTLDE